MTRHYVIKIEIRDDGDPQMHAEMGFDSSTGLVAGMNDVIELILLLGSTEKALEMFYGQAEQMPGIVKEELPCPQK